MIRKLQKKDAEYMLEWMRDPQIIQYFQVDFANYTKDDVLSFIAESYNDDNQHFAFVDETDEYLGTISLKNISYKNRNAEYAIVTREIAQGTGAALRATEEILAYAWNELKLKKVYLNVLEENERANHFYKKCGFVLEGKAKNHIWLDGRYRNLNWYAIFVQE